MTFEEIKRCIRRKDYLFSEHADEERTKDQLSVQEVEEAIVGGNIVEERLHDTRGESRLIGGLSKTNKLIHVVVGQRFDKPVIVTVYLPSEKEWIHGIIRKRKNI